MPAHRVALEDQRLQFFLEAAFFGKCHDGMAVTGSVRAAAPRVPGSVVHQAIAAARADSKALRIGHPLGVMEIKVVAGNGGHGGGHALRIAWAGACSAAPDGGRNLHAG